MNNPYPFLPSSAQENAERIASRTQELWNYFFGEKNSAAFPQWVLKMGKSFRDQALSRKVATAVNENDELFLLGVFLGGMVALKHYCLNPSKELEQWGLTTGIAVAQKLVTDAPIPMPTTAAEAIETPEANEFIATAFSALHQEPREKRARFLEGMLEGNDIELFIKTGAMRPGSAYWIQFLMLIFWPEIDAMKTRREAYDFIQFCLKLNPIGQCNEESFIKLARHYGFKSRKGVNGDDESVDFH